MFLRLSKNKFNKFVELVTSEYNEIGVKFHCINRTLVVESPVEEPDHYSVFAYWTAKKLGFSERYKILDVGNTKSANLNNSLMHDVTALVLDRPDDSLSEVCWLKHDISDGLPFPEDSFDVFTSASTLHLIGLGRYGDKRNARALLNFLPELRRVTKKDSKMFLMLPLGLDQLIYGFHFIYSLETIIKIFSGWELIDYMVDNEVRFGSIAKSVRMGDRFSQDADVSKFGGGDYKIIYLEFKKK